MSSGANSADDAGSSKKNVTTSNAPTTQLKKPNSVKVSNCRVSNTVIPLNNLRLCRSDSEEYFSDSENSPDSENIVEELEPQGCIDFDSDSTSYMDPTIKPEIEIDDDIYGMDGAPAVNLSTHEKFIEEEKPVSKNEEKEL